MLIFTSIIAAGSFTCCALEAANPARRIGFIIVTAGLGIVAAVAAVATAIGLV